MAEGLSDALVFVSLSPLFTDLLNRLVEALVCLSDITSGLLDILVKGLRSLLLIHTRLFVLLTYLFAPDLVL